jgi:hypothetical protein
MRVDFIGVILATSSWRNLARGSAGAGIVSIREVV